MLERIQRAFGLMGGAELGIPALIVAAVYLYFRHGEVADGFAADPPGGSLRRG
jgi:hypothetical protein